MAELVLLKVEIRLEYDVVLARRRARQIAKLLNFDMQDQIRLATAVSELARNVFQYAGTGRVVFAIDAAPIDRFRITVTDQGPGIGNLDAIFQGTYQSATGLGLGIRGASRLVDDIHVTSSAAGTTVEIAKALPRRSEPVTPKLASSIVNDLTMEPPQNPFEEMQGQNQELLAALELVQRQKDDLARLNGELAAALDEARRASAAKSDFLATMSHEVRTPLNAIVGITTLLQRTDLSAQQDRFVDILHKSASSMATLVNDLLDVGKIEDNKIELEALPFDLAEVMERVVEIGAVGIGTKDVVLSCSCDGCASPAYIGDAQRLHQILLNLVSNAVKFTEHGTVTMAAREQTRGQGMATVAITISDTGIGISAKAIGKIFDKYVQADISTTRRFGGTGLGLSIARSLAERMSGSVTVESEAGVGSVFTVVVPLGYAASPDTPPS